MKLSKKGFALEQVPQVAIALLIVSIVLGVGANILTNVQNTASMSSTSSAFYQNSTFVADNSTAVDFTPSALLSDSGGKTHLVSGSCTSTALSNSTADVTSLFTVSGCTALLKAGAGLGNNATNIKANFTYTFNTYTVGYNSTEKGLSAQDQFSGWQATFVVVLAAAVVIGIVGRYLFFA